VAVLGPGREGGTGPRLAPPSFVCETRRAASNGTAGLRCWMTSLLLWRHARAAALWVTDGQMDIQKRRLYPQSVSTNVHYVHLDGDNNRW